MEITVTETQLEKCKCKLEANVCVCLVMGRWPAPLWPSRCPWLALLCRDIWHSCLSCFGLLQRKNTVICKFNILEGTACHTSVSTAMFREDTCHRASGSTGVFRGDTGEQIQDASCKPHFSKFQAINGLLKSDLLNTFQKPLKGRFPRCLYVSHFWF